MVWRKTLLGANVKKLPLWPALIFPSASLPAFSLLRVTLARSSILIGWTPLSLPPIGWRKSLLHYRYMATALPAIRGMIEKCDWERVTHPALEIEAAFDQSKTFGWLQNHRNLWSFLELVQLRFNFVTCTKARLCLMPSIISIALACFFCPRNWFVEVLKMHHCLQRAIMIPR